MNTLRAGILMIICCAIALQVLSQDEDIKNIPEQVKKNAAMVIRNETIEFTVSGPDYAKLVVHRTATALDQKGLDALEFAEITDQYTTLEDVQVKVFDAAGKNIGKYKKRDVLEVSLAEGLIDEYKGHFLRLPSTNFPVTVETSYEIRFKGTIAYPKYEILKPDEGVENSSCTVKVPKTMGLRYQEKNISLKPVITEDGDNEIYTWTVSNLGPVAYEEDGVSYESRFPSILLAPNQFKLNDYPGDMRTWKSFGKWYASLKKGTDVLPEARKQFFRDMVSNAKNVREQVGILYDYLQHNFRYVSIQLGIGGFKPQAADFTDTKEYGDCKALCNFMQTALAAAGIRSYSALVNAGFNKEPVDPDFPCDQFNHVILCVPLEKDSIWLECTSRTTEFGKLGPFTENRNVLLITEDGGVLVPTPKSKAEDNTLSGFTRIQINEDGSGKTNTLFSATGEYKQDLMELQNEKTGDQKNYVIEHWGFKDPAKLEFSKNERTGNSQLVIDQELEKVPELKATDKMFLTPRVCNLWAAKLPKAAGRKQDFYFNCPFKKTDTTIYELPQGYVVDALPEPAAVHCSYAAYSSHYFYDEKKRALYCIGNIDLKQYKIPAFDYPVIKDFFDKVVVDNSQRIVIKKQ